jgi:hypothetical protein
MQRFHSKVADVRQLLYFLEFKAHFFSHLKIFEIGVHLHLLASIVSFFPEKPITKSRVRLQSMAS